MRYTIEIKKVETIKGVSVKQMCVKETATDKVKQKDYGNGTEIVFDREYKAIEEPTSRDVDTTIYTQTVEDLDIAGVIQAVNKPVKTEAPHAP